MRWRPVLVGFIIQFLIALLVLKTKIGFCFFQFLGAQVEAFLKYTDEGIKMVFTMDPSLPWIFAFRVLPIIIFFSSFVTILFHTGIMLFLIKKITHVTTVVMGTTAGESLVAVANIFIGQR